MVVAAVLSDVIQAACAVGVDVGVAAMACRTKPIASSRSAIAPVRSYRRPSMFPR